MQEAPLPKPQINTSEIDRLFDHEDTDLKAMAENAQAFIHQLQAAVTAPPEGYKVTLIKKNDQESWVVYTVGKLTTGEAKTLQISYDDTKSSYCEIEIPGFPRPVTYYFTQPLKLDDVFKLRV